MPTHEEAQHKRDEAATWLLGLLTDGPRFSKDIFSAGKTLGFSRETLFRARTGIAGRIRAEKVGNGGWYWRLVPEGETVVPPPPPTIPAEPVPLAVLARPPQPPHWWHHVL
jgi:hypothetical protein